MAYTPEQTAVLDREPLPAAGTTSAEVAYEVDGTACSGYLARPDDDGLHPGVLVVHNWLGVTDAVRFRADMLARLGYVAFAVDVFGVDVRPDESNAHEVAGIYYGDQTLFRTRLTAGLEQLLAQPGVDSSRTAAMGYCFGGAGALQLARTGADLRAVVSFHGALQPGPAGEAADIRAKVLVLTGAIDPVVPPEAVDAFEADLKTAPGLDWQVVTYSGSMHAFTEPGADAPDHGAQFNPVAEARSWQAMKDFFAEVLAG
jgi:dienelactone hydrolase